MAFHVFVFLLLLFLLLSPLMALVSLLVPSWSCPVENSCQDALHAPPFA